LPNFSPKEESSVPRIETRERDFQRKVKSEKFFGDPVKPANDAYNDS
jgi:hypothetical protein